MSGVGFLVLGAAFLVGVAAFQTGTSFVFMASGGAWGALLVAWAWARWQGRGAWALRWGGDLLGPAGEAGEALAQLSGPPGRRGVLLCPTQLEASRPPRWLWWSLPGPAWRPVPFALDEAGLATLRLPWPPGPRGVGPAPSVWRLDVDPWGLMPRARPLSVAQAAALRRHPQALPPAILPWLDALAGVALGQAARGAPGAGAGVRGVRPHASGDPLRAVHWRTTARLGGAWHVREAEREATPVLNLHLDRQRSAHDPASFEAMAAGAAALAAYAAQRAWPCRLHAVGAEPSGPSLPEALAWLAELSPLATEVPVPGQEGAVVLGPRPPAEAAAWVATPMATSPEPAAAVASLRGTDLGDAAWQGGRGG